MPQQRWYHGQALSSFDAKEPLILFCRKGSFCNAKAQVTDMAKDMPKSYDHSTVEDRLYAHWEEKGYFHAEVNENKPPYCIVIPPPNVTGQLHMGHALDETLQDILIRYKRMSGYETLWLPGTDHASIATEVKIVEQLKEEGKTKESLGREGFMERAWEWKNKYSSRIVGQLKKLGASCDWERERFTMDEGCSKAVIKVFADLYRRGLIYRGDRIINWCPVCKTAISDAEVEFEEKKSNLWHVRYDAPDKSYSIVCATTRPETILGDTGIAVNPEDERYKDIVGKTVIVPIVGRKIPIVADPYVEKDFGTGAVKITPSHDPNDFEVGMRCDLPQLCVFTPDGHVNELGGKYEGLTISECRKVFVADLEAAGALIKIEPYTHNVGTCYRCHSTIEPMVSKQWFVKIEPLAKPALEAVRSGKIRFIPEMFDKTYYAWMENIHDWCISRQLWWGHRIPAYYCDACGETIVEEEAPACCPHCGGVLRQDEDVLDTWFSSGMWPFSTLGWPEITPELKYFYPTSTLATGRDLIFFWIARMIMFGLYAMEDIPFENIYIHGMVRDELGRKMSKSLGNGIDPLEVIRDYGADSLRFSLTTGTAAGSDMRYVKAKVEAARNFCNKIYNAARFVIMNAEDVEIGAIDMEKLDITDKWILSRTNNIVREITTNIDSFDLNLAAQKIYDFIWTEFCDWYIEMAKPRLYSDDASAKSGVLSVLIHVLRTSLKLLHPFMPFITEELYLNLPGSDETIMLSSWPVFDERFEFDLEEGVCDGIIELIRAIRNVRVEMNVPPSRRTAMLLVVSPENAGFAKEAAAIFMKLAGASSVDVVTSKEAIPENAVSVVGKFAEAFIPLGELIDIEKELERINKEIARLNSEVKRYEGKLNNPGFIGKAPEKVIEEERAKLASANEMLLKLNARLCELKNM